MRKLTRNLIHVALAFAGATTVIILQHLFVGVFALCVGILFPCTVNDVINSDGFIILYAITLVIAFVCGAGVLITHLSDNWKD